jgi:hypothetical protein
VGGREGGVCSPIADTGVEEGHVALPEVGDYLVWWVSWGGGGLGREWYLATGEAAYGDDHLWGLVCREHRRGLPKTIE